jgi:hypothetical protein
MGLGVSVGDADFEQLGAVTNEMQVAVRHPVRWRLLEFAGGSGVACIA